MANVFWILIISVLGFWILSRFLAWLLAFICGRVLNIKLHIGEIGFLSCKDLKVVLHNGICLEIGCLWVSSNYVNSEIKKQFGICLDEVRIQSNPPTLNPAGSQRANSDSESSRNTHLDKVYRGLQLFQFVSISIKNVTVMLLDTMLPECLVHGTIPGIRCDLDVYSDHIAVQVEVAKLNSKLLKKDSAHAPCLAEVTLHTLVNLKINRADFPTLEELSISITEPDVMVSESVLPIIKNMRQQPREGQQRPLNLHLLQRFIPKKVNFNVIKTYVWLRRLSESDLVVKLETLEIRSHFDNSQTIGPCGNISVSLQDMRGSLTGKDVFNLSRWKTDLDITTDKIQLDTIVHAGHVKYRQNDAIVLLDFINTYNPSSAISKGQEVNATGDTMLVVTESTNTKFQLLDMFARDVIFNFEMSNISSSFSSSSPNELMAGLNHVEMHLYTKGNEEPVTSLSALDLNGQLQIDTVYCTLAHSNATQQTFVHNKHYWDTVFYIRTLSVKAKRALGEIHIVLDTDTVHLEWTSTVVSLLLHLIPSNARVITERPTAMPHLASTTSSGAYVRSSGASIITNCDIKVTSSNVNLFFCNEYVYVMVRLDSAGVRTQKKQAVFGLNGLKITKANKAGKHCEITNSRNICESIGHLREIKGNINMVKKTSTVDIVEEVFFEWSTQFHMCLFQVVQDIVEVKDRMRKEGLFLANVSQSEDSSIEINLDVNILANVMLAAYLSKGHRLIISSPQVKCNIGLTKNISFIMEHCSITFDDHEIVKLEGLSVSTLPVNKLERDRLSLELPTNSAWEISFESVNIIFPYLYNFASCFQEIINTQKWLKLIHKVGRKPFTVNSPLPPDIVLIIKEVIVQLSDDPFEVKLGDNFELMSDEQRENDKRFTALEKRIQELKKTLGLLPANKVNELYNQLREKASEIYTQRHRKLYKASPMRTKLFTWTMCDIELIALADRSFHGKENVVKNMREIDITSPYPSEGLEFNTLWCRMVNVSIGEWLIQLRDYPQPMLDVKDLNVWGRIVAAEQAATSKAVRTCNVEIGQPWGDMTVDRNMPSLKFYYDFTSDVKHWVMCMGPCWDQTIAQYTRGMELVNQPSKDPSLPLPFWDKIRLLLHGRLTMAADKMSWLYHASLNPYNTTEMMDWTWSDLCLDWTTAKFVLKGDLDIYARTESKYDDCRLLYVPKLRFCVRLDWLCHGDPNDHHSVMPCAPDKIPENSFEEHDSFRAFRSKNLAMSISFETRESSDEPSCVFYASTVRWIDKVKMCMIGNVTRPTRRGSYYGVARPKKLQLSRHFSCLNLSVSFHQFNVCYWVSFARQHGVEMKAKSFTLQSGYNLTLVPIEDGLIHRLQSNWTVKKIHLDLNNAQMWLCSSGSERKESLTGPVDRNYFLSLSMIKYERDDETDMPVENVSGDSELVEKAFLHRVYITDLKAAWTRNNRNTVFGLFDGYRKAQSLRKNLSSDALKGFKVDNAQSTPKPRSRTISMTNPNSATATPSPLTRIQSGHGHSMLQRLVQEIDTKMMAFTEEPTATHVEQLHGKAACQTKDVIQQNLFVELTNSQVMLQGSEIKGYVIVSAARAEINSCLHKPVWRNTEPKSKTTWVSILDCMQYFATVDPSENVMWLEKDQLGMAEADVSIEGAVAEMAGLGHSVGGLVTASTPTPGQEQNRGVQLQRMISRCKCQLFYASYGEVDSDTMAELPLPDKKETDMLDFEEGIDLFTLLHHDLNICTNPLQYGMILDIVNNLLLYVEPKRKESTERMQSMRFKLRLSSEHDEKTTILHLQEEVRQMFLHLMKLEKNLYVIQKEIADELDMMERYLSEQYKARIEDELYECKEKVNEMNEELTIMITCYTQNQLEKKAQLKQSKLGKTLVVRRNEVCFRNAQWKLTETDGQLGIADIVLRNFLYSKVNINDDSWTHQLEVGWLKMTNLLPNSIYKDVLVPRDPLGQGHLDRQVALRIFSRGKAPVGGINVMEHFEVNVVPLSIQLTYQFFKTLEDFFFPARKPDTDEDRFLRGEVSSTSRSFRSRPGSVRKQHHIQRCNSSDSDVIKMKERAATNNTFIYIKIPEVPLKVSYKGQKEKNIVDITDFTFILPTLEYHSQTWTWQDLLNALKGDSKKVILSQAIKQKLHMKSKFYDEEVTLTDVQQEEDKAKMLLGAKLMMGSEKPPSKKSLFGKQTK